MIIGLDVGMIVSGGPGIDPEYFRTSQNYHSVGGPIDHRGREVVPIMDSYTVQLQE